MPIITLPDEYEAHVTLREYLTNKIINETMAARKQFNLPVIKDWNLINSIVDKVLRDLKEEG